MLTLMTAALVAAQAAPAADPHAGHSQVQHGQGASMQHEKHAGMKDCCCKECCKGMEGHDGQKPQDQKQPKPGA